MSLIELRLSAEITPIGMPISSDRSHDSPASCTVKAQAAAYLREDVLTAPEAMSPSRRALRPQTQLEVLRYDRLVQPVSLLYR